jgi:diguanylate cyclase (GGDEF)-like protein
VYLDLRTLQVAAIVVCCVLGPTLLAFSPAQRQMQPARYWGAGLIALAWGLALGSLHGHAPDFVVLAIAPCCLAVALTCAQFSARAIAAKSARDVAGLTLLGMALVLFVALEQLSAPPWLAGLARAGTLGLLACRTALAFTEARGVPEGRPLYMTGLLFAALGFGLFTQATLAVPGTNAEHALLDPPMLAGVIAVLLLGTILVMWVTNERMVGRIRELGALDPLTGVLNRPAFVRRCEQEHSRARRREEAPYAILLFDIDRFSLVNEAHGNSTGDRLLEAAAGILREAHRDYDLAGRMEGDVFALLAPGTGSEGALRLAERARRNFELMAATQSGLGERVSVSIGIAICSEHGESVDTLLGAARVAMLFAKTLGGNQARVAMPAQKAEEAETEALSAGA